MGTSAYATLFLGFTYHFSCLFRCLEDANPKFIAAVSLFPQKTTETGEVAVVDSDVVNENL